MTTEEFRTLTEDLKPFIENCINEAMEPWHEMIDGIDRREREIRQEVIGIDGNNGQKSKVTWILNEIHGLNKFRWQVWGGTGVITVIIGLVIKFFIK